MVEKFSGGYIDQPRKIDIRIEGKVELSFSEVDIDQATHVPLPADITWPNARLTFQKAGTYRKSMRFGISEEIQLYTAQLEFKDKKGNPKKANLSNLTSKHKPILFTGTGEWFLCT